MGCLRLALQAKVKVRPQHGGLRDTQTQVGAITETLRPLERNVHT